jgi:protein O-mannosyl-transferase
VLLLSDYAQSGDWRWKRQLDKLPFLAGAFAFGWYAVSSSSLAADQYAEPVSFLQRVVYSFQAFSLYVTDSVIPFRQSAITPFPTAESGNYLLLLVSGILIATAMLYLVVRHLRSHPAFVFGLLFFMVNIFPTLHVIGLNSSLIYDRFTYLAYIGLFVAIMRSPWPSSWSVNRKTVILAMSAVPFSLLAYQRTLVWKSSLTLWNDVLEKHPRTHEARNNRGASFNEIGQLDRALEDFNASLEVNPNQPRTLNNRSMIWFRKADYTRSLQDAEKALEMEPRLAEAWCNRGNAYFGRQQYDTAILYYNRAIELMPNFPSNYCNRGTAYLKQGDFQKAVEDYLQSISQAPDYVEAWRLLGLAYAELDEHDKAIAAAEKARSLDPRSDSYQVLSKEYLDMGIKAWKSSKDGASEGLNAAIAYFEKALAVNPNNADALEELGGMWFMKRDVVKARDFWRKALVIDPKLERARQGLEHTGGI